jgi:hypothetical protein
VVTPEEENEATPEQENRTVVNVLHMPGRTYIGQPRPAEPEPEAGQ